MARPRDPAIQARNREIYARWSAGENVQQLAERYDRKPVVIGRIIARQHPEQKDGTNRALMRGRLEWLLSEMRDVIQSPGVKLGPNGRPAEDFDGEPLPDLTTKVEATKVALAVLAQLSKNDGSDKPQPRDMGPSDDVVRQQYEAALFAARAKIEADRREIEEGRRELREAGKVIRGEIEPPGQPAA